MTHREQAPSPDLSVGGAPSETFSPPSSLGSFRTYHSGDLPSPGTKGAPKIFSGQARHLLTFLEKFERISDLRGFSSTQKCTIVREYCSDRVTETIEGLKGY